MNPRRPDPSVCVQARKKAEDRGSSAIYEDLRLSKVRPEPLAGIPETGEPKFRAFKEPAGPNAAGFEKLPARI